MKSPKGVGGVKNAAKSGKGKGYGKRPKDAVIKERIAEMIGLLARSPAVHISALHAVFCAKWNCHYLTVNRMLIRARREMTERLHRSKEVFRVESLAFYEAIAVDPNATAGEKIRARERVDRLFGLDAPMKTEVSGPEGGPIAFGEVKVYVPAKRPLVLTGTGDVESDRGGNGEAKHQDGNGEHGNGEA